MKLIIYIKQCLYLCRYINGYQHSDSSIDCCASFRIKVLGKRHETALSLVTVNNRVSGFCTRKYSALIDEAVKLKLIKSLSLKQILRKKKPTS